MGFLFSLFWVCIALFGSKYLAVHNIDGGYIGLFGYFLGVTYPVISRLGE